MTDYNHRLRWFFYGADMGLNKEITSDLQDAFNSDLKDAVSEFTGIRHTLSDDDWLENGNATNKPYEYIGRGMFSAYRSSEIDGNTIIATDVKLIVLQAECDEIQIDDVINGYQVVHIAQDPARVSMTVQLRQV